MTERLQFLFSILTMTMMTIPDEAFPERLVGTHMNKLRVLV